MVFQRAAAAMFEVQCEIQNGVQNSDPDQTQAGGGVLLGIRARRAGGALCARVRGTVRARQVCSAQHVHV